MWHVSSWMTDSKSHIVLISLGPASDTSVRHTGSCLRSGKRICLVICTSSLKNYVQGLRKPLKLPISKTLVLQIQHFAKFTQNTDLSSSPHCWVSCITQTSPTSEEIEGCPKNQTLNSYSPDCLHRWLCRQESD